MQVGLLIPQGWKGEYDGWDAAEAWARTVELARHAEELGFESAWVFDHFTTVPDPTDEITFESFSTLAALAMATERVRLGHMVICTGFRNPALTAKLRVDDRRDQRRPVRARDRGRLEGGRVDRLRLRLPETNERLARSGTTSRSSPGCSRPGRATYEGKYASVRDAINEPEGRPGATSRSSSAATAERDGRLAVRFADELNFVYLDARPDPGADGDGPAAVRGDRPRPLDAAACRCTSPTTRSREPGQERVDVLGRLMGIGPRPAGRVPDALGRDARGPGAFAEDCRAAGLLSETRQPAAVR